jgi:hypothetical protein
MAKISKGGTMNEPEEIKFKVDEEYQNEKGVFKVISMHRGNMLIRWKNGEEIRTKVELQRRIAQRRQWEKDNPPKAKTAKASRNPTSTKKKAVFPGFVPTDFKKSVARTTWRSRSQLGTEVTQKIEAGRFKFNSWAFGYKPEMHFQDIKHRKRAGTDWHARFFIRVDSKDLYYGFRVSRPDELGDGSSDWENFMEWLAQQENEQVLDELAIKDNLTCRLIDPSSGNLVGSEYIWRTDEKGPAQDKNSLTRFINDVPGTAPFDLELSATIDKSNAVACGSEIASNIAQLFNRLVPLYQAAVTH